MHYLGKMKIPKIAQMFRFTIDELSKYEVKRKIKIKVKSEKIESIHFSESSGLSC